MTAKIVRIIMVLLTVFVASIAIPDFYRTSFKRNVKNVRLNYSEVSNQFLIWGLVDGVLQDTLGNRYTQKEYERLVPFSAIAQLIKDGDFPDTVAGVAVNPQMVTDANYQHTIYLTERGRYFGTMPLCQGGTNKVGYVYDNDMMRINRNGIEFYDCETNSINVAKSALFDRELRTLNYAPPAKKLYGIYSASKRRDDGLFFLDSQDQLFQVKYFAGKPICREIPLPEGFKLRKMECQKDHNSAVAYLLGDHEIYVLTVDDKLLKLDLDVFDYDKFRSFDIMGNLFYRMVSLQYDGYEKLYIFDLDYKLLDSYAITMDVYEKSPSGVVETYLFPFITTTYSFINGFDISSEKMPFQKYIWGNLLFAMLLIGIKYKKGLNLKNPFNLIDVALVAAFGIFAFISVLIYPIRK